MTERYREAVTVIPLMGPVTMYVIIQGWDVVVSVKLEGGEFSVRTCIAPQMGSVAYMPTCDVCISVCI